MRTSAICFCILLGFAGVCVFADSLAKTIVNQTVCEREKNVFTCHFDEDWP